MADNDREQLAAFARERDKIAWGTERTIIVLQERVERMEKLLRQIMLVKPIHCVTGDERHGVNFGDVGRGIAACQEIARKGLEGKSK